MTRGLRWSACSDDRGRASPLAAELLSVKFGLELAVERRLGIVVVIETDCLEAVRVW